MRRTLMFLSSLILAGAVPLAAQQTVRIYKGDAGEAATVRATAGGRAMLGISTSSGSRRDTLGVLVSAITAGGPAEKAGLAEGDRIQAINGVSLRVSREDAADDEMGGLMQRRLTRELGKLKAGDDVSLQVWHDGSSRAYKVKTVAADDLVRPSEARVKREEGAVIGIGFGLTGSKRDTAGIFVNSVSEDGPAEKAGIIEGDRIAAINGVSLRLTKDDLEDGWVANARLNRLSREVAKAKAGDVVELTVVSGGRARAVKVTTVKASALKASEDRSFTIFRSPDAAMAPMPPMPPLGAMTFSAPRAPAAPRAPVIRFRTGDADDAEVRVELEGIRKEVERTLHSELPRVREEIQRSLQDAAKAHGKAQQELQTARVTLRSPRTIRM